MRVLVLCTGNVARSPALAALLTRANPALDIRSAALGAKAKSGRRMAKPMRQFLTLDGLASYAAHHRSTRAEEIPKEWPELVITMTPKHRKQAALLWPDADTMYCGPIKDPAWGGEAAYESVYEELKALVTALDVLC